MCTLRLSLGISIAPILYAIDFAAGVRARDIANAIVKHSTRLGIFIKSQSFLVTTYFAISGKPTFLLTLLSVLRAIEFALSAPSVYIF